MKSLLYCTADTIGTETGGGAVTNNELLALKEISNDVTVLERKDIDPAKFHQPGSPFLEDYFALEQAKSKHFDLAHFYSGCFSHTIRWLKEQGTKITYTIDAHNRKISIEEFHKLGLEYPFHNISDDALFNIYIEGHRLADVVIAPSTKSAELLRSEGCRNVVVIPHGVTLPRKVRPIPDKFDVAYLGAVGPDKGLVYLIQAWGMLNYPDSRLILAGGGTETLEPFISQLTDKGLIVLLGRVPNISEVYNACSTAIFPSVTEGFGIGILEAMSYGRPVITTEGAGAADCINNGLNGFIVPIRSPEAIADRIDWFRNNREKIPEMGQKARMKARNYTWSKIRAKYKKVFLELTSES